LRSDIQIITDPEVGKLLADETRRKILRILGHEEMSATDLAKKLDRNHSSIVHHLNTLIEAKLIQITRQEQVRNMIQPYYRAVSRDFYVSYRVTEALEEDPDFAIARGTLGLLYIQFLGRGDEGRQLLTEALSSASEVSRREYLMLRAVHRQFVDQDPEEALADYRMISEFYPDAMEPYNNSGRILQWLGRYEEAAADYERVAALDLNLRGLSYYNMARAYSLLEEPGKAFEIRSETWTHPRLWLF